MTGDPYVSTGFTGLDEILDGLRIGDNVVWSVDRMEDYRAYVKMFVNRALADNRKVVYMRFGSHAPVVPDDRRIREHQIDAYRGFEWFATRIHEIIAAEGRYAFYVFDCLSELLSAWATDSMIGNFFSITCPYLFDLDTVAYFSLRRGRHSFESIERIRETTQLLINLYHVDNVQHIHPIKVWKRRSPTMFLPHQRREERFYPVANSNQATRLLGDMYLEGVESAKRRLDHWDRLFMEAESLTTGHAPKEECDRMLEQLCGVMIGRDERILTLARKHFTLEDLLAFHSRMIGTGYLGGKSVGMLLARNILLQDSTEDWAPRLEPHDSHFIGSDVYYSYLIHNKMWPLLMRQKTPEGYFEAAEKIGRMMLEGEFPGDIRAKFQQMLDYYGQYPIIVRSSSLLEDGFGNAFAGKYDSYFCVNQGSPEERLERLEASIRLIYASAMSEDALAYRRQRNLDRAEEQMALLIQRVSGTYRKHFYFPDLAGVGVSYNTFVWDPEMDPQAGLLRLVLGLGTRAVDRVEGDYPRIMALDAPLKLPHKDLKDTRRYSQRKVDVLNLNENEFQTVPLHEIVAVAPNLQMEHYGVLDLETMSAQRERTGIDQPIWLLTFENLVSETDFVSVMNRMLKTLERAYQYPVDVEYTIQYDADRNILINPVQCRPLQAKGQGKRVQIPENIDPEKRLIDQEGLFMGGSAMQEIKRIIWIYPEVYAGLSMEEKHQVGRIVRMLNDLIEDKVTLPTMLMGPGRWGTTTPELGVPIRFADINHITILVEVSFQSGEMIPELSFGSHFFQDLVENDIFYLAIFPESIESYFNLDWILSQPNRLAELLPERARWESAIHVADVSDKNLKLMADIVSQRLLCLFA